MEQVLANLPAHIETLCEVIGAITILATVIVRLTPSKKDDESVLNIAKGFWKAVSYLPTIGINPRTKKLEEAYKEVSGPK